MTLLTAHGVTVAHSQPGGWPARPRGAWGAEAPSTPSPPPHPGARAGQEPPSPHGTLPPSSPHPIWAPPAPPYYTLRAHLAPRALPLPPPLRIPRLPPPAPPAPTSPSPPPAPLTTALLGRAPLLRRLRAPRAAPGAGGWGPPRRPAAGTAPPGPTAAMAPPAWEPTRRDQGAPPPPPRPPFHGGPGRPAGLADLLELVTALHGNAVE